MPHPSMDQNRRPAPSASICHRVPIMTRISLSLAMASVLVASCASTDRDTQNAHATQNLSRALECRQNASPDDIQSWVHTLQGHTVTHGLTPDDQRATYTLPSPIQVFDQPVSTIAVETNSDDYGPFVEYSAHFEGQNMETVGRVAQLSPGLDNVYHRQIGTRDLSIRPESGRSYIVCANGVRSVPKSIRYWAKRFDRWLKPNGYRLDPEQQNNPFRGPLRTEHYEIKAKPKMPEAFSFEPPEDNTGNGSTKGR